jgi:hypothetical protein
MNKGKEGKKKGRKRRRKEERGKEGRKDGFRDIKYKGPRPIRKINHDALQAARISQGILVKNRRSQDAE